MEQLGEKLLREALGGKKHNKILSFLKLFRRSPKLGMMYIRAKLKGADLRG
jgi:hypothetical protein